MSFFCFGCFSRAPKDVYGTKPLQKGKLVYTPSNYSKQIGVLLKEFNKISDSATKKTFVLNAVYMDLSWKQLVEYADLLEVSIVENLHREFPMFDRNLHDCFCQTMTILHNLQGERTLFSPGNNSQFEPIYIHLAKSIENNVGKNVDFIDQANEFKSFLSGNNHLVTPSDEKNEKNENLAKFLQLLRECKSRIEGFKVYCSRLRIPVSIKRTRIAQNNLEEKFGEVSNLEFQKIIILISQFIFYFDREIKSFGKQFFSGTVKDIFSEIFREHILKMSESYFSEDKKLKVDLIDALLSFYDNKKYLTSEQMETNYIKIKIYETLSKKCAFTLQNEFFEFLQTHPVENFSSVEQLVKHMDDLIKKYLELPRDKEKQSHTVRVSALARYQSQVPYTPSFTLEVRNSTPESIVRDSGSSSPYPQRMDLHSQYQNDAGALFGTVSINNSSGSSNGRSLFRREEGFFSLLPSIKSADTKPPAEENSTFLSMLNAINIDRNRGVEKPDS